MNANVADLADFYIQERHGKYTYIYIYIHYQVKCASTITYI